MEAAAHGHVDILKLMLQRKADATKKLVSNGSAICQCHSVCKCLQDMLVQEVTPRARISQQLPSR
jgi:hypothetical protein